jgi:hypothetical protein
MAERAVEEARTAVVLVPDSAGMKTQLGGTLVVDKPAIWISLPTSATVW